MNITIKKKQGINLLLKCNAVVIGYLLWLICGSTLITRMWLKVPVCFYNVHQNVDIDAPEALRIYVSGKRFHFRNLDTSHVALHINAQNLREGEHLLTVNEENLLLPEHIKVINWVPLNPTVTIRTKEQ